MVVLIIHQLDIITFKAKREAPISADAYGPVPLKLSP